MDTTECSTTPTVTPSTATRRLVPAAQGKRRRAAQREAERPVCKRCGRKFSDERWVEITVHRTAVRAGHKSVCGPCRADDVAREEAARLEAAPPPDPEEDPEPGRGRGWFRRRP
ncbi:hypothetical protein ACH4PR_41865 [Streptomyces mirabilis]|uniref:hypothetical protein n=1 Tax=Streptomyces mirabilis TaxID=68239 RepID=UPI0037A0D57D